MPITSPTLHDLSTLEQAAAQVHELLTPTAQIHWPVLSERCGCDVWVKHEHHNPTGAFKVRGGKIDAGLYRQALDQNA